MSKKPEELLKEARESRGWTQADIADRMGISSRQYQNYEDGKFPKFKSDVVKNLDNLLGTNLYEIIYEKNVPRELDESRVNEEPGSYGYQNVDYLSKRRELKNQDIPKTVPLVPIKAQAGYIKSFDQQQFVESLEQFGFPPGVHPTGGEWRYFEVDGDSMQPSIYAGDFVLGSQVLRDDWENVHEKYVYILITESNIWIKRVYPQTPVDWILISENENYPSERIKVTQVKELWVFRRHQRKVAPMTRKIDIEKIIEDLNNREKPKP